LARGGGQPDTHRSASLVHFVATLSNLAIDLGQKGKHGMLKNRQLCAAFLRGYPETTLGKTVYLLES
jgi:hypothetical protein